MHLEEELPRNEISMMQLSTAADGSSLEEGNHLGGSSHDIFASFQRRLQYHPWAVKFSLLDRRLLVPLTVLPLVVLLVVVVVPLSITGEEGCVDRSESYRGRVSSTQSGLSCVPWTLLNSSIHAVTPLRYDESGLAENYCRDPDGTGRVWCYTSLTRNHFDFCHVKYCSTLETVSPASPLGTRSNTDTSCIPKLSVFGVDGSYVDGSFTMTDRWANGRGVYKKKGGEVCISWHAEWRHWWITPCWNAGHNSGNAWLEEDARCPNEGRIWRKGGSDALIESASVQPVYSGLYNCLEYNVQYQGQLVSGDQTLGWVNISKCRDLCFKHPTCKAFNLKRTRPGSGNCHLLHRVHNKTVHSNSISGTFACNMKVKVGCPKDGLMFEGRCVQFLNSKAVCRDGCSRFRAMEECEVEGGYLLEDLSEDQARKLLKLIKETQAEGDWWLGASDILDAASETKGLKWERSRGEVVLGSDLWWNSTAPLPNTTPNTHSCLYLARQRDGFVFDVANCDTPVAQPLCSFLSA